MSVNLPSPLPKSPGKWINLERCSGCGETFADHRANPPMTVASARIRARNDDKQFRSRGPLLWEMHVMKVEDWFLTHMNCGTPPGAERHLREERRQSAKQIEAHEQEDGLYTIFVDRKPVMENIPQDMIASVNDMIHNGRDYDSIMATVDQWFDAY